MYLDTYVNGMYHELVKSSTKQSAMYITSEMLLPKTIDPLCWRGPKLEPQGTPVCFDPYSNPLANPLPLC
jgi:hypothetical protein